MCMWMLIKENVYVFTTGFTSNGEFNSLRSRGYTRPLSMLQIRSDVRRKYARLGKKKMFDMLTPRGIHLHV